MDRLSLSPSLSQTETIYRCAVRKPIPYSAYFSKNVQSWSQRIRSTEKFLESIEPFYRKVQISIVPQQPFYFQVHNHHIRLGEEMLELPGHLERALVKIWFRERHGQNNSNPLIEESLVDFLMFAKDGDVKIADLKQGYTKWNDKLAKGPFLLQSVASYCDSSWRRSEHFFACETMNFDPFKVSGTMGDLSLRPLVTQSWIQSYLSLNAFEKYTFVQNFSDLIRSNRDVNLSEKSKQKQLVGMEQMIRNLKESQAYAMAVKMPNRPKMITKFKRSFQSRLHESGFFDSTVEAHMDFLYVSSSPLSSDAKIIDSLLAYSKEFPLQQIAVRDQDSLWLFPSRYPISLNNVSQVKSKKMVLQICGNYDFAYVLSFADQTEKLLVVNECENKKLIDYAWYLKDGIEAFSAHHPDLNFVQYHLPSLAMKAEDLKSIKNVFDLIQTQPNHQLAVKSLGWQKVQWNESAQAYRPEATIEGIEWFRVSSPASSL